MESSPSVGVRSVFISISPSAKSLSRRESKNKAFFTCHSADSWSHFICSQVNMFTDPFFETNPTTDTGKALTGLQLVKTMSKRATGPFGASALLKEFAKTCPGSQLHGSTVVFLEKLHLCIPPKCCNPHENCSEVPRVLLPHTSRMPYSICLPTTIGSFSLGRV